MSPSFPSHTIPFPRDNHGHQFLDISFHIYFMPILYSYILPQIVCTNIIKCKRICILFLFLIFPPTEMKVFCTHCSACSF